MKFNSNTAKMLFMAVSMGLMADVRPSMPISSLERDESGFVVLNVQLSDPVRPGTERTFRFLLDTGTSGCAIDVSVPSGYFWEEPYRIPVAEPAGPTVSRPCVLMKRMEVGGIVRDAVQAFRMDLRTGCVGAFQDHPVDGILGMSFLRGTRFLVEPSQGRIRWWPSPLPEGAVLRISWGSKHEPTVAVRHEGREGRVVLDTGHPGGITLPWARHGSGKDVGLCLSGREVVADRVESSRIETEAGAWCDVPVWHQPSDGPGLLGLHALLAGPVYMDFLNDIVVLPTRKGELPYLRNAMPTLPIRWDRSGPEPRLVIHLVKPGSALDRAGARAGDFVLEADGYRERGLSRSLLQDLLRGGRAKEWRVLRDGKERRLSFMPTTGSPVD